MGFGGAQGSSGGGGSLGVDIATGEIQDGAVTLAKMANLATDKLIGRVSSSTGVPEAVTCTDFAQGLLDDTDAAAGRTTLGLGTISTQAANNVSITGGSVTGITDLAVADGGTGASTLTGLLKGNGTSPFSAAAGLSYIGSYYLTTASANHTTQAGTTKIVLEGWGGGGGGGGVSSTSAQAANAGGGGSGGYAFKVFTVTGSTAYAYTCGSAGTAGANTGGDGGNGGDSTFTAGGTTVTAKGGVGGKGQTAATGPNMAAGGAGGAAPTNADSGGGGQPGTFGSRVSINVGVSGNGGSTRVGGGGVGIAAGGAGTDANGYGAGGGGALCLNGSGAAIGGVGTQGYWIVHEFGA